MLSRAINPLFLTVGALLLISLCPIAAQANEPIAIQRAEGLELSKAVGHWARARTFMLQAIREFDKGNEVVDPDALIDAGELRSRMLDHIHALDRVIDPQPRATEGGVRFDGAPELLGAK